ncbi:hypothetical protein GF342_05675 [Candidatus Woesearchaeota archaeon]|nr:hypothetical protein [Candidatus Woesearchaeota archaeon]
MSDSYACPQDKTLKKTFLQEGYGDNVEDTRELEIYCRLTEKQYPDFRGLRELCMPDRMTTWVEYFVRYGVMSEERRDFLYALVPFQDERRACSEVLERRVHLPQHEGMMPRISDIMALAHRQTLEKERKRIARPR